MNQMPTESVAPSSFKPTIPVKTIGFTDVIGSYLGPFVRRMGKYLLMAIFWPLTGPYFIYKESNDVHYEGPSETYVVVWVLSLLANLLVAPVVVKLGFLPLTIWSYVFVAVFACITLCLIGYALGSAFVSIKTSYDNKKYQLQREADRRAGLL